MRGKEFHANAAETWVKIAKCHKEAGCDDLAGLAGDMAEHHLAMCKAEDGDEDLNKLVPTKVHGVIPSHPQARLIPRVGQELILPQDEDATAALDKAMGRVD